MCVQAQQDSRIIETHGRFSMKGYFRSIMRSNSVLIVSNDLKFAQFLCFEMANMCVEFYLKIAIGSSDLKIAIDGQFSVSPTLKQFN